MVKVKIVKVSALLRAIGANNSDASSTAQLATADVLAYLLSQTSSNCSGSIFGLFVPDLCSMIIVDAVVLQCNIKKKYVKFLCVFDYHIEAQT